MLGDTWFTSYREVKMENDVVQFFFIQVAFVWCFCYH